MDRQTELTLASVILDILGMAHCAYLTAADSQILRVTSMLPLVFAEQDSSGWWP